MVRLGLVSALPKAIRAALQKAGAPDTIADLYALWVFEIGPDFWTFCAAGAAQAAAIKEILALSPAHVFRVSLSDPHPTPYLRVLLAFHWCRYLWGRGEWDDWQEIWLQLYQIKDAPANVRNLIQQARKYIPLVSRILFQTRFDTLNGSTIPDLFDFSALAPAKIAKIAATSQTGVLSLSGLAPGVQLAVFRRLRDCRKMQEETIDRLMTQWLVSLGKTR
jgi:hypothetical protein